MVIQEPQQKESLTNQGEEMTDRGPRVKTNEIRGQGG